jgi:hypothetical protein
MVRPRRCLLRRQQSGTDGFVKRRWVKHSLPCGCGQKLRAVHVPNRLDRKVSHRTNEQFFLSRSRCMNGSYPLSPSVDATVQGKYHDPLSNHSFIRALLVVTQRGLETSSIYSRSARATNGSSRRSFWPFSSSCCAFTGRELPTCCTLARCQSLSADYGLCFHAGPDNQEHSCWLVDHQQSGRLSGRSREFFFSFDVVVTSSSDLLVTVPQPLERRSPPGFNETTQLGR